MLTPAEGRLAVGTGAGLLVPLEVQPENRRAMAWDAYLRGARLGPGALAWRDGPARLTPAARAVAPPRPARRASRGPRGGGRSARGVALEILLRTETAAAYADRLLETLPDRAGLDPRDRALATELVLGTLRWQRRLDWALARVSRRPLDELAPWVRALLRLTAYQLGFLDRIPPWAAVHEAVELAKRRRLRGRRRLRERRPPGARGASRARGPPRRPRTRWRRSRSAPPTRRGSSGAGGPATGPRRRRRSRSR